MSDDLKNHGEQDRLRINFHEGHEVRYWTKELNVAREELERTVKDVGVMAADGRKNLGKQIPMRLTRSVLAPSACLS
jgi:hypothetical protein